MISMDKDEALKRLTEMFGTSRGKDGGDEVKFTEKQERRAKAFVIATDLMTEGGRSIGDDLDTIETEAPSLQDAISVAFAYGVLSGIAKIGAAEMRDGYEGVKKELAQFEMLVLVAMMIAKNEKSK